MVARSTDNSSVIVYDISFFPTMKMQYITREKGFWGELKFCNNNEQFVADFSDKEVNGDKTARLGLWRLSDLNWTGTKDAEILPYKLLIKSHYSYIERLKFSDNGRYAYCKWNDGSVENKVYKMIDLEIFFDVTFPDGRNLAPYEIMEYTNLLMRSKPFEIYDVSDLSQPLYVDPNGHNYQLKYRAPQYLNGKKGDGVSCLLKYDKENASIHVQLDNIDGEVRDTRQDGSVLAWRKKKGSYLVEKILFYDSEGSKVELFDAAKSDIKIYDCEFSGISDKAYACGRRGEKVDISFDLCTEKMSKIYDQSTCAQWALLQSICTDGNGNQNDTLHVPNDLLATAIWDSFNSEQKTFLQDTLRLSIKDNTK